MEFTACDPDPSAGSEEVNTPNAMPSTEALSARSYEHDPGVLLSVAAIVLPFKVSKQPSIFDVPGKQVGSVSLDLYPGETVDAEIVLLVKGVKKTGMINSNNFSTS